MAPVSSVEFKLLMDLPALSPPKGVMSRFSNNHSIPLIQILPGTVLLSLCTASVAIRFYTRLQIIKKLGWDDYVSFIAWVGYVVYSILCLWAAKKGAGIHAWNLRVWQVISVARIIFIVEAVYGPVVLFASFSILLQYLRIFVPCRDSNRFVYYGTHYLIWCGLAFFIVGTFVGVFICSPVRKAWNPFVAGRCLDTKQVLLAVSCLRVFFEFQTLILPLYTIWNLQMGLRRKIGVSLIFGGGLFVCIVSIVRTVHTVDLLRTKDFTHDISVVGVWSHIEIAVSIICGCLPTFPKFFQHVSQKLGFTNANRNKKSKTVSPKPPRKMLWWKIPTYWHGSTLNAELGISASQFGKNDETIRKVCI